MRLSERLETVASFVDKGSIVADVGTDHGYIPVCLVERGICPAAIGMDVRPGPLSRAREHIEERGLGDRIQTRLGDGLEPLAPGEADTAVIAGMGGELIIRILENGRRLWGDVRTWILSPQSEIQKVRLFLWENGFRAVDEAMVLDEGKYYTVMKCRREEASVRPEPGLPEAEVSSPGLPAAEIPAAEIPAAEIPAAGVPTPGELRYGRILLERRDPVLRDYLEKELEKLSAIEGQLGASGTEKARARLEEVRREIETAKEAYDAVR